MRRRRRLSRRGFLRGLAYGGGGLVLGCQLPFGFRRTLEPASGGLLLDTWLRIGEDGTVTILCGQSEMGQGIYTSLPMLVAEELEVPWESVRVAAAPAGKRYRRPRAWAQYTGGSSSVRGAYQTLREAGAAARELLVRAAAARLEVDPSACEAREGRVHHPASGRSFPYRDLVAAARRLEAPERPRLKDASAFTLIGRPVPRIDGPSKVDGSAVFGLDVRVPGMVYAAVRNVPAFGGRLVSTGAPERLPKGILGVFPVPGGMAVVAESTSRAMRYLDELEPVFAGPEGKRFDEAGLRAGFEAALAGEGREVSLRGDPAQAMSGAARVYEARFSVPFLAHATMEPQNATASVTPISCDLWVGTQAQESARDTAVRVTGLPAEAVRVHTTLLGGGFGRRFEIDVVEQAVSLSHRLGRPVQVVWSRAEDMQHDFYRPAAMAEFRVGVDAAGMPVAWESRVAVPSILARVAPVALVTGVDPTAVEGIAHLPYDVPATRAVWCRVETPVPVGFWRSVGSSQNAYFVEAMLDEVARAGGHDPVEFRLRLLGSRPRHKNVLETVARISGWGRPLPPGRHRGVALHESFGSIVAEVVELSLAGEGLPRVHRVWCALDCGSVVNPDTVVAQMESGIVFGLAAALYGRITLEEGRVRESSFDDYRLLRLEECPEIEVEVVASGAPMGGIGEPGTPPLAPALVNALLAATGKPVRSLPLLGDGNA